MRLVLAVPHGCDQADQSTVGAVARDGICYHPKFAGVFTGDDAASALIPVKNQLFVQALLNHIFVDNNLAAAGNGNFGITGLNRIPTGSWQTVLGRMNRVARALAGIVAQLQLSQSLFLTVVNAIGIVAYADGLHNLFSQGLLFAHPTSENEG